jgi:hypothetical protein
MSEGKTGRNTEQHETDDVHRVSHRGNSISRRYADRESSREGSSNSKVRTGIVSVNGRDVGEMRCTGGRRSA